MCLEFKDLRFEILNSEPMRIDHTLCWGGVVLAHLVKEDREVVQRPQGVLAGRLAIRPSRMLDLHACTCVHACVHVCVRVRVCAAIPANLFASSFTS